VYKGKGKKGGKNVTLVDDAGVNLLMTYYIKKNRIPGDLAEALLNSNPGINTVAEESENAEVIKFLQQQLEKKDEQINNLLTIVSNQHKLKDEQFA
jgi:hypothetical protein